MSGAGEFSRDRKPAPLVQAAAASAGPHSWAENHSLSEELAAKAEILTKAGRPQARAVYRLAAQFETVALAAIDPSKVRTLGITAVSAVALWFKSNDLAKAKSLANRELAKRQLPDFAVEQLRELLARIAEQKVADHPAYDAGAMIYQEVESLYDRGYDPTPGAPVEIGFTVTLTEVGRNKIDVIKVIREVTGLGLKEAKELVENAPVVVKAQANKVEAAEINAKIRAAGAVAEIK